MKFYALNPNGSRKWEFATQGAILSSPAIDANGTVYFTSVDGRLYAVNPDGSQKWRLWTGGVRGSSPVIDSEGNIFLGVNDFVFVVNPDGTKRWDWRNPVINGAGAVTADGTIYFGAENGTLLSWKPDRTLTSFTGLSGAIMGSPAIGADGTLYVGTAYRPFRALQGKSSLAKSPWPKFRGDAAQTGRAGAN